MNAPLKHASDAATTFVRRHIGPSPRDIDAMLETVGAKSLSALMAETLPGAIRQKARLDLGREKYALIEASEAMDLKPRVEVNEPGSFGPATRAHIRNFIECVRTRKEPSAPVEAGQSTNIVLCMALESLRSGRRLRWNGERRRVEA